MDVIECLAVLHEENMAMVKRLLRPVDSDGCDSAFLCTSAGGQAARDDEMLEITLTWPPGEILTPLSTPTEYNYRVRHAQAAKDAP